MLVLHVSSPRIQEIHNMFIAETYFATTVSHFSTIYAAIYFLKFSCDAVDFSDTWYIRSHVDTLMH